MRQQEQLNHVTRMNVNHWKKWIIEWYPRNVKRMLERSSSRQKDLLIRHIAYTLITQSGKIRAEVNERRWREKRTKKKNKRFYLA